VNNRALGYISIKVADDFKAAGKEHKPMLNVCFGHGGTKAVTARNNLTRIVCSNTFNMAMREKSDFKLSIRHTSNAKIMDLAKAIDLHFGVVQAFKQAMDEFQAVDVVPSQARKIYAGFLIGEDTAPESRTGITRFTNQVDRLTELFSTGKGNTGRNMEDVFSGVTDYFSHYSSGGDDKLKQFTSSEFGAGDIAKREFFSVLSSPDLLSQTIKRGESVLATLGL
jgi:hypothetical protein